jgi:hypothetical protein
MGILADLARAENGLEHDPEKWEPVFGQDHARDMDTYVAGLQPGTKADVWCDEKAADGGLLC